VRIEANVAESPTLAALWSNLPIISAFAEFKSDWTEPRSDPQIPRGKEKVLAASSNPQ
jgi:hypothetical protein